MGVGAAQQPPSVTARDLDPRPDVRRPIPRPGKVIRLDVEAADSGAGSGHLEVSVPRPATGSAAGRAGGPADGGEGQVPEGHGELVDRFVRHGSGPARAATAARRHWSGVPANLSAPELMTADEVVAGWGRGLGSRLALIRLPGGR